MKKAIKGFLGSALAMALAAGMAVSASAAAGFAQVEPDMSADPIYDFTLEENVGKHLVLSSDLTRSDSTAYCETQGTDATNYVELTAEGAKLYDNSASASTKLVLPAKSNSGTFTVSGTITPTSAIGTSTKLVDIGVAYLTTDTKGNVIVANKTSGSSSNNAGPVVKGQEITYEISVDFDYKTVSASITNGEEGMADYDEIKFASGVKTIDSVTFATSAAGTVSSGNDCGLIIPAVTVSGDVKVSPITKTSDYTVPAIYQSGTQFYVVSVVEGASIDATVNMLEQQLMDETAIDSTNTVYEAIKIGDKTYRAKDFFDGLEGKAYIYASIINNNNKTPDSEVVDAIQSGVSTVLTTFETAE